MPNIIINSDCNKSCSFCFESEFKRDFRDKNMTALDFRKALDFIVFSFRQDNKIDINIVGGEPLCHPDIIIFFDILNEYAKLYPINVVVFTNGILARKYVNELNKPYISLLVNVSENLEIVKMILSDLNELGLSYTPSITVSDCLDTELIDYVVDYAHSTFVRIAVAYKNVSNSYKYFMSIKNTFINVCKKFNNSGFILGIDCTKIPICLYTEDEINLLNNMNIYRNSYNELDACCEPCIDILPDLTVCSCMPMYESLNRLNIADFDTFREVHKYFILEKFKNKSDENTKFCGDCKFKKIKRCFGGCLGFKSIKINRKEI